jgi:hypothetical protein
MILKKHFLGAGLFLIMAPACMAATVRVDSTPGFDFSNYKRYSWRVHPVFEKRPELAEKYSVGIELVKNTANQILISRGFQSTRDEPNFYITFLLTGEARKDIEVVAVSGGYGWGGWYGWPSTYYPAWSSTVVSNYVEGLLVLDVVDAKTSQLAWRAYCRDDVRDWKNRDKNVKKVLDKALKQFPPKSRK